MATLKVSIGTTHYTTTCVTPGGNAAASHTWLADEPPHYDAADKGPSPYELLLSALGACKAITCRMYADRKGWPMTGMTIDLAFTRRHADDCTDCDNPKAMLDHIDCALDIQGPDLTDDQRKRIAEIADQCPVHKTLRGDIRISTTHP